MRTLLIDNYDSFTFNLFHLLGEVNGSEPIVVRNDELSWEELVAMNRWTTSSSHRAPGGPSTGATSASRWTCCAMPQVPVLGVCLGHQALAHVTGGAIEHAPEVMHGRAERDPPRRTRRCSPASRRASPPCATTRSLSAPCRRPCA